MTASSATRRSRARPPRSLERLTSRFQRATANGRKSARRARSNVFRRRRSFSSHSSRSASTAGTGLHAPHLPFAIPARISSIGWKGVLRLDRSERGSRQGAAIRAGATRWLWPKIEVPYGAPTMRARLPAFLPGRESVAGVRPAMILAPVGAREGRGERGRKRELCAGAERGPLVPRR